MSTPSLPSLPESSPKPATLRHRIALWRLVRGFLIWMETPALIVGFIAAIFHEWQLAALGWNLCALALLTERQGRSSSNK